MHQILLFYNYVTLDNPEAERVAQRALCERLGLTGRVIVASEGINATLEGTEENIEEYCLSLQADPRFANTHLKKSISNGQSFPKLSVKVRDEIVSSYLDKTVVTPARVTGTYLSAEELHEWIHNGKEFYMVDMRNEYEHRVGYFQNSILPPINNFRELPTALPALAHLKDKTVVTVCTGGVRCEKASGFLLTQGFKEVYQLYGGIVTYMEKYPGEDFKGSLYVFDGRVTYATTPEHEVVGRCEKCGQPAETYVNCANNECHRHFICCMACSGGRPVRCENACLAVEKMVS